MADIVYILGTGSNWQDNELRFSLRSLETHLHNMGTVFVAGERPKWLTGVVSIPYRDKTACKERNIMLKLAHACGHPDLSENFLHVHDDHFALAPADADNIPNWFCGSIERAYKNAKNTNDWHKAAKNTHQILTSRGLPANNFDLHLPMMFNKTLYPQIMDQYPWTTEPRGYIVKSLYANTLKLPGTLARDVKLNDRMTNAQVVERLKGREWFSIGNGVLTQEFKRLLPAIYPNPSRYEIK